MGKFFRTGYGSVGGIGGRLHIPKQGFTGIRCEDKVVLAYKAFCLGGQPVCLAGKYMHPHGMEFLGMYGIHRFTPNVMHSNVAGKAAVPPLQVSIRVSSSSAYIRLETGQDPWLTRRVKSPFWSAR